MFESVSTLRIPTVALDHGGAEDFALFSARIERRSTILWGEHCSECAAPACYASCSFYTPRAEDLNCGRFQDGIKVNRIGNDGRIATLAFRQWGKLEGHGPVRMVSTKEASRLQRRHERVSSGLSRWSPNILTRRLKWEWDKRFHSLDEGEGDLGQYFAIEAWLPDEETEIHLTFTVLAESHQGGLYQKRIELVAGYNQILIPVPDIASQVSLNEAFVLKLEPFEDALQKPITFGTLDFVEIIKAEEATPAGAPPKVKCVVWDLDNTVWDGTLAEDGLGGLRLRPGIRELMDALDQRGILQSVASKNDHQPAMDALSSFGLADYLLYPQISWDPKSEAVRRISELLDIGLDTFVFIDDQPFERAEVQERLPRVRTLDESSTANLLEHDGFDVPATPESAKRRHMYLAEQERKVSFESSAGDYLEFLRGCELIVEAAELSGRVLERAVELSQRTNQLNVSGRRYDRREIESILSSEDPRSGFVFRCEDRFGDYGVIALCVVDESAGVIESFMMSCRVQRKRVEHAVFGWICDRLSSIGHDEVSAVYRKTERNDASVRMFEDLQFRYVAQDEESGRFTRQLDVDIPDRDIVTVITLNADPQGLAV